MKIYEMHQAKGERITVSSLAQAQEVMADFEPFADKFLAEVERATSVEDEPFAFLQRIATRWNANYEVWKAMEADEELQHDLEVLDNKPGSRGSGTAAWSINDAVGHPSAVMLFKSGSSQVHPFTGNSDDTVGSDSEL